jgi:2,3-bisphosphoglycerate-independent phosphoglycerate mutase
VQRLATGRDRFVIVNYANPDMVGHTGSLPAAIQAVQVVDECLGRVLDALDTADGRALITSDHGNCEVMIDPDTGGPHTAHTTNRTPCIVTGRGLTRADGLTRLDDGRLCDVAPTILRLMGLAAPPEMTGRSLIPGSPPSVPRPAP